MPKSEAANGKDGSDYPNENEAPPECSTTSASPTASSAKKSGFQLYLDSVRESLAEDHPELDDADLVKKAILLFKSLPLAERTVRMQGAVKT